MNSQPDQRASHVLAGEASPVPDAGAIAIRGGAIRVAGYLGGVLVSLGTATILVRHLGVPAFGRYVTVASLIALVGGVTEAGTYVYGIREFAGRGEHERRRFISDLLGMRLALTCAGIAAAAVFALAVGYKDVLVAGTLVAGAGLLFQVASDVLSISLQANLQLARMTAVDLTRRVAALLLVAVLALLGAGLLPLLAAQAVAAAVALALVAWIVRASLSLRIGHDVRAWRSLIREASLYAVAMSIGAVYFYVTVVLMSLIASATQTGYFATSFRVTQVALGVPILLLTAIFPLTSRERLERPDAGATVAKVFTVALICGLWMSLAIALGASVMIDVIAGGKGRGAVSVLQIQGVVLTASFVSVSSSLRLISLRRYRPIVAYSAGALVLDVVLGLVLIPGLGARGGALADVITEVVAAVAMTAVVIRAVPRHGISARPLLPVVLAAALAATARLMPIGAVGRVVAASAIYFAALLWARAVPEELWRAVRRTR